MDYNKIQEDDSVDIDYWYLKQQICDSTINGESFLIAGPVDTALQCVKDSGHNYVCAPTTLSSDHELGSLIISAIELANKEPDKQTILYLGDLAVIKESISDLIVGLLKSQKRSDKVLPDNCVIGASTSVNEHFALQDPIYRHFDRRIEVKFLQRERNRNDDGESLQNC